MASPLQSAQEQELSSRLRVDLVQRVEDFRALEAEWDDLLADSRANTIALTHRWQLTWWETFKAGRELCILTVRDSLNRLVGIAPLLRRRVLHRGLVPLRRLEFLATGEDEADEIDSDYLDFILRVGWEPPALAGLLHYLVKKAPFSWDEFHLGFLPGTSVTLPLCQQLACDLGLRVGEPVQTPGVLVHLPTSWEEYLARFIHKTRYHIRRDRRLVGTAGDVQFRWTQNAAEFEALYPTFVELHQKCWQAKGRPGCFSSERFTAFHRQLAQFFAPQGTARIAALLVNQRPVAARYLFLYDSKVYDYQSGQDPTFMPKASPGQVLVGYCLEAAIAEGLPTFDFLKGVPEYKQTWSQNQHHQVSIRLTRPGSRDRLRTLLEGLVKRARRLRLGRRPIRSTGGGEVV